MNIIYGIFLYIILWRIICLEQYISVLKDINSCITTLRLYPPENKLVSKTLDQLTEELNKYFQLNTDRDDFLISISGNRLIINDKTIDDKQRNNPIVISITALFDLLDLKSISIKKGIERNELITFFTLVNKIKTSNLIEKPSINDEISKTDIKNIAIDETVYIALGKKDKEALDEADISIVEAVKSHLISLDADSLPKGQLSKDDIDKFFEDPERVGRILNNVISEDNSSSFGQKSRNMTNALNRLANMIPEDREEYLVSLLSMLKNISPALGASFLMTRVATQKKPSMDADKLILYLDDETIIKFADEIEKLEKQFLDQTEKMPSDKKNLYRERVRQFIKELRKYTGSFGKSSLDITDKIEKPDHQSQDHDSIIDLKEQVFLFLRDFNEKFNEIPDNITALSQILSFIKDDQVEELFEGLKKGVYNESFSIDNYIEYYSGELNKYISDFNMDKSSLSNIIKNLLTQIDREIELNIWYSSLIGILEQNIHMFFERQFYDIISWIYLTLKRHADNEDGIREKEQTYYAYCMLKRIEIPDLYNIILNMFKENKVFVNDTFYMIMIKIPNKFIAPVLGLLKTSSDMKTRKHIITYLTKLEDRAIDPIINELNKKQDWFYYRNLLIILGDIAFPSTVFMVKSFIDHEEKKVQKEAINALLKIKSHSARNILCEKFSDFSDDIQIKILNHFQLPEIKDFLEPIKRVLSSNYILEIKNNNLLKKYLYSIQEISLDEANNIISEILWGHYQHLLGYHNQEFLISIILNLLWDNKESISKEIMERMKQDNRNFIKKATMRFLNKKKPSN